MIKNVIFDIGNVLSAFCWQQFLKDKGFDDQMIERIGKASVMSESWYEFDKGVLSDEEVIECFIANDPGIAQELHFAFDNVKGMVRLYPYSFSWIRELKSRGFKVYYLSNFSHKAETQCPESVSFLPETDGGILSYKVKMTKPDPEIYRLLLKKYGLKASECVFLDDTLKNIRAAEAEGIKGIHFTGYEAACFCLNRLLQ